MILSLTDLVIRVVILCLISYLIGSIPTGYIIVKLLKGIDIRTVGSGSTGATNVKRELGTKWFFVVMVLDAIKGAIPVLIAMPYSELIIYRGLIPSIVAVFAVIGHCKPVFLKFKGGKSVATGIGTLIALYWPVGLIVAGVWAIIAFVSKYVSLGSIIAVAMAPILMNLFGQNIYYIYYSALCAIIIVLLHRDNIKRLLAGQENKVRK